MWHEDVHVYMSSLPSLGQLKVSHREVCTEGGTLQLVLFSKLHDYLVAKHAHPDALNVCAIVVVHDTKLEIY